MTDAAELPYELDDTPLIEEGESVFHPDAECDSDERRQETAEKMWQQFLVFKNSPQRLDAEQRWRAAEKLYFGYKITNERHEVVIREAWRQLRTWLVQISKGLTAGDVLFKCEPRLDGFEDQAAGATAVIHDQLKRSGSREQMDLFLKCVGIYGVGYIAPGFRRFKSVRYKMTPLYTPTGEDWWESATNEVIENLPYLENISPWDVFTHPKVNDASKSPYVFIYREVAPDGLKTLIREGWIDADATRAAVEENNGVSTNHSVRGDSYQDNDLTFLDNNDRPHEMIIAWGNGWEFVILDGRHLLRAMPLPDGETPIISAQFDPMPDRHYGECLMTLIGDEQRVVNTLVACKLGNLALTANPILLAKRGTDAKKNWNNATLAPGGRTVIECDNPSDLQALPVPQVQSGLSNDIEFWQAHQREQTGINDRISGLGANSGTATGATQLSGAATEVLEYAVRLMSGAFERMYRAMYNLNARNLDHVYCMRVAGNDGSNVFAKYTPEVFTPDVDINIEIGGGANPQAAMMAANNFKLLAQAPGINMLELAKEVLRASGAKSINKFLQSAPHSQGDALNENSQWQVTGILADPKPSDNHAIHVQVHQMAMQQPTFAQMPPYYQQQMAAHLAIHQQYMQQAAAANSAMQQQPIGVMGNGQGVNGGATPVEQNANAQANQMFNLGDIGAQQNGGVAA